MNLQDSVEECCVQIESNRITDRKKHCERLSSLLDNEEVVSILNQSNTIGWKYVMSSVQECLRKDADKIMEDAKKKGTINNNKFSSAELFLQILKISTSEADFEVNVSKIVGYIIGSLRDQKMKKCYDTIFLRALKDYILSNTRCRGKLESEEWTELFTFIKKLYEERPSDMLLLKCISLIIKWGPNSGLPAPTVRVQFEFITKFCLQVTRNCPTSYQEDVLDTALDFCKHTAKDNRVSCCKLGEDVYSNFVDLYELNGRAAKIKEQLIEFFLLQVTIHQPNGITEDHPCAYACDWTTWKKCLKITYSLLSKEINFYFKYTHKNNSFFIVRGDSIRLLNNFSDLFVQVSRQLFSCPDIDVTMSCSLTMENVQKRQKLDINLKTYISNIQETKSWLWVHIVCSIISSFPQLLEPEDFLNLLQILSNIQIESNNPNVIINIYTCLSAMLDIQHNIITSEYQLEIDKLWKIVGESTLRAFALNQHKEATENILQKLICRRIIDPEAVLQSYTAGVLNFSLQSIRTLETVLQYLNFAKSDDGKKEMLMNCVLNSQNIKHYQYLLYPRTAKVLVNITLKQWPMNNEIDETKKTVDIFDDIKDIYFKTMLTKKIFTFNETGKTIADVIFSSDLSTNQILANVLQNFVDSCSKEPIEHLLSIIMLLVNVTNYMIQYKVLSEDKLNNYLTVRLIEKIFNYDIIKKFQLYENRNEREAKKLTECLEILVRIFQYNEDQFLATKLKEIVPFELLRNIVNVLNDLQEDQTGHLNNKFELKKAIARALSSFGCISGIKLNQNQKHILEVLSAPYNCSLESDYVVLHTFLTSFKNTKPGIIENNMFNNILKSVEEICVARYQNYENAVEILIVLHDLYPHLAVTNDDELKITSVALLKPFYDKSENYGPKVSLCLLDCIIQLCKVDPENKFSFWEDREIIKYVPTLLCSDYQEVRFKAIEALVKFLQVMSKSKRLENFHKQEEIFTEIYEMSIKVFDVTGEITQERRIDEIITRTASVLHTYTSIILYCNTWIRESFFALVKLVYKKELKSVDKVLQMINQHFCGEAGANCIEKYIEYILEKWLSEGYSINNFRFELFQCENKLEFYLKYFEICVLLLMGTDRDDLVAAGNQLQLSEKNIVELTCSKIFASVLCNDIENMANLIEGNSTLNYYSQIVGLDGLKKCLIDNMDQLVTCILSFLTDEIYIHECFDETVIFSSKNLSVGQLKSCLKFVESFLCEGSNIATFLSDNPGKLEKVLLSLKMKVYNIFTTDDKLISFHRYGLFIDIILENLRSGSCSEFYFIRDTIYTLINFIENHKNNSMITLGICKFLSSCLKKILPKFAETFERCFIYTVNSLKNYAIQINTLTDICIEILRFLIVQNSRLLKSSIKKLDNFPQQQKFYDIRKVHMEIKYGNKETSLEDEINYFLQHEDLSTRQDSLVHLRKVLCKEKIQLKQLYDKLQDIRGFSEDCEKSLMHRLICLLAKMSCSTNEDISFEAVKCLGELGPANLMTLVLQPEKEVLDAKCSPLELLTGQLVALLSKYITHNNIKIVKTASEALYIVLDSKEGKKVADSDMNFGHGLVDKQWLQPFFQNKSTPASNIAVDAQAFAAKANNEKLWCPDDHSSHKEWIVLLVTTLLETFTHKSFLSKLVPICKVKPKLCEHLLPLLINILLHINNKLIISILSNMVDEFFSNHWNLTVPKPNGENSVTVNKKSVKCMLNVVSFVRLQKSFAKTKSRYVGELDLNYLKVAKAAEFCAAHFTALLYSELWCQNRIQEIENGRQNFEFMIGCTTLDIIYENENEEVGEALQNILRNAYKAIGDLDALPGCGTSFLVKPQFRVEHYKELGKWEQVTHFYEMQVSHGDDSARKLLMESLKNCSLYHLPLLCTKQSDDAQYECLWRLGQWNASEKRNLIEPTNVNPVDFDKYRFYALKSLHDNSSHSFIEAKKSQTLCVIENLKHISLENSQNMYPILTQLQALVEMEDFAKAMELKNFVPLLNKWKLQDALVKGNDFQYIEPIVAQRIVMVSDYLKVRNEDTVISYLTGLLLDFAELAREEGHFQVATTALGNLQTMSNLNDDITTQIQLMDAKLSWSINNKLVARHILNKLCKNEDINPKLRYTALKLSGQYMSETYSENRLTIISDYFLKSLAIIKELDRTAEDKKSIVDTYDKLAQFADKGYQQIMTYMKSDLFQRKIVNMEKAKETASNIRKQRSRTKDECQAAALQHKQSNIDEIEINNTKQERNHYLRIALKYYLMNLTHTDDNNIKIFRIMSICLENRNNPIIVDTLKENLPSYKYITMLPQLIPHITEIGADWYNEKVNQIFEKCAIEHPHHTLPLLLFLANSNKDQQFNNPKTNTSSNDARMITAKNMIKKLKKREDLYELINKLQQLSEALIELAYYNDQVPATDDEKKNGIQIPKSQKITKIRNLDVLLPTHTLPVSKTFNYSNIVTISSFGTIYHPVGGINAPKRITCRGSDGKVRSQLVKGHDDIRQDAVMQQVFRIMNNLLSNSKQTRNLLIRTYKIVPLSMRSGILEWVDNTIPIGKYLVGEDKELGAHHIYRPQDRSPESCRKMFKGCANRTAEEKLQTFKTICKDFKPIFHKFFESSFPHPTIWYERKRAYIHSVATTSMCGYILGIGDRHVSNILIDKTTAEVIHIDFGIAFEQGRVLPTPETVPFRLSRDIVDGMGVSGVEGIFRRSCEKTMEVLRQNSQTIITILEVLLYDPLYVWTVTAAEANKRQTDEENDLRSLSSDSDEDNNTVNITAERALLRLREKLQGTELGNPTSIEHQVGTLIQQAMDPVNLCKLFCGWQPYL